MNIKQKILSIIAVMVVISMITVTMGQVCIVNVCEDDCGTKVEQCDIETVNELIPVRPGTTVGFYDKDNDGIFDTNEGAVIDMDPNSLIGAGIISDGDVRVSACLLAGKNANTLVSSGDADAGQIITLFPPNTIDFLGPFRYADFDGDGQMDMEEGIYIDTDGDGIISTDDLRITQSPVLPIGIVAAGDFGSKWSRVMFGEGDNTGVIPLVAVPRYQGSSGFVPAGFATSVLAFVDSDCSAGEWSSGNKLYLQQPHGHAIGDVTGWQHDSMVTFGDTRVFIPPNDPCGLTCGEKVMEGATDAVYALTRSNDAFGGVIWVWSNNGNAVYMDMDASGDVTLNDVRLSVCIFDGNTYQPNTLVEAGHSDLGIPLPLVNQRALRWADNNGNGIFDLSDPLYLDIDNAGGFTGAVSPGDIRLTDAPVCDDDTSFDPIGGQKKAWSVVQAGDPEIIGGANLWFLRNLPLITPKPPAVTLGILSGTPRNLVAYVDVDCSLDWSAGDILYVQRAHNLEQHDAFVTIGDSRLYVEPDNSYIPDCGTKVSQCDTDMTYSLEITGMNNFNWGYRDGNVANVFDQTDAGYIDMDGSNSITEGDIRVSTGSGFEPNTIVIEGDGDINDPLLIPANQLVLTYWDINQNNMYDISDPIYIDTNSDGVVSIWDIRITMSPPYGIAGYTPGELGDKWTKVLGPDGDRTEPLTPISSGIPSFELRYIDSDSSLAWTIADKLYLQQIHENRRFNLGFEAGGFIWPWWLVLGNAQVVQANDFFPAIQPSEGNRCLLLTNGPGDILQVEPFMDWDGALGGEMDKAILTRPFFVSTSTTVSFDLALLTDEANVGNDDDIFYVAAGPGLFTAPGPESWSVPVAVGAGWNDYPEPLDNINHQVVGIGPCNGMNFDDGVSPFQTYNIQVNTPGINWITFYVADQNNALGDTGLLIDNVNLGRGAEFVTIGDARLYIPPSEDGRKGDFDGDGDVDFDDFVEFAAAYNSVSGDANYSSVFDFDNDGDVDFDDFVEFAGVYET